MNAPRSQSGCAEFFSIVRENMSGSGRDADII